MVRVLIAKLRLDTHGLRPFAEFAEFTAAQERIALGKKGKKVEASKRREAMSELIADVYALTLSNGRYITDSIQ